MKLTTSASVNPSPRYIRPKYFANHLSDQQDYCLFLDIDGTLADFTLNPKDSVIPNSTLMLLQKIQRCGIKIAIVTGRSLAEAKQMLSPLTLPIAATHGLEIAFNSGVSDVKHNQNNTADVVSVDSAELAKIRQVIVQSCHLYNDLSLENKPYSVALHFRKDPTLAERAYSIMTTTLKNHPDWVLKPGKFVWEIVPKGVNKGAAILTLLKKMDADTHLCPIFIGDDMTDEAGFIAVQDHYSSIEKDHRVVKGIGIKVGSDATCAHYYVNDIPEATALLSSFLSFCQTRHTVRSELADVDSSLPKITRGQVYEPINCLI